MLLVESNKIFKFFDLQNYQFHMDQLNISQDQKQGKERNSTITTKSQE